MRGLHQIELSLKNEKEVNILKYKVIKKGIREMVLMVWGHVYLYLWRISKVLLRKKHRLQ